MEHPAFISTITELPDVAQHATASDAATSQALYMSKVASSNTKPKREIAAGKQAKEPQWFHDKPWLPWFLHPR